MIQRGYKTDCKWQSSPNPKLKVIPQAQYDGITLELSGVEFEPQDELSRHRWRISQISVVFRLRKRIGVDTLNVRG